MTNQVKIIILGVLLIFAAALIAYGAVLHSTKVLPQQDGDPTVIVKSEPALIKEASVGGVTRDASGKIKQTYTGEPPEECPT